MPPIPEEGDANWDMGLLPPPICPPPPMEMMPPELEELRAFWNLCMNMSRWAELAKLFPVLVRFSLLDFLAIICAIGDMTDPPPPPLPLPFRERLCCG